MNRREFSKSVLLTLSGVALFDTLFRHDLFGATMRPIAYDWLKDLHVMCKDLKTGALSGSEWQSKIDAFHATLTLDELLKAIDFEKAVSRFRYPDLGVVTNDPKLPKIAGVSERYSFIGRIFGLQQNRAIIPHGHKHMASCHRVLQGEFLLRQYDKIEDADDHLIIRQTIEETASTGSFSSISDEKNNVHWLIANTKRAFTFDVIVVGLNDLPTEIHNIDIDNAVKIASDLYTVKKMSVTDALTKYGKSHH